MTSGLRAEMGFHGEIETEYTVEQFWVRPHSFVGGPYEYMSVIRDHPQIFLMLEISSVLFHTRIIMTTIFPKLSHREIWVCFLKGQLPHKTSKNAKCVWNFLTYFGINFLNYSPKMTYEKVVTKVPHDEGRDVFIFWHSACESRVQKICVYETYMHI